jgi:ABC-type iron transport system FetAB ATPase subunit
MRVVGASGSGKAEVEPRVDIQLNGARGSFRLNAKLEIPARGVTAVFGRSGSGKTTLLRALAGLEHLSGRVTFGGVPWQDTASRTFLAPERRRIGYVFQEAALRSLIPPQVPIQGAIDFPGLSQRVRLSGGYIRNAALRAAFLAAEEGSALTHDHLERAIRMEFREIGKLAESGTLE